MGSCCKVCWVHRDWVFLFVLCTASIANWRPSPSPTMSRDADNCDCVSMKRHCIGHCVCKSKKKFEWNCCIIIIHTHNSIVSFVQSSINVSMWIYLWISSTICLKFDSESNSGAEEAAAAATAVVVDAALESLVNSKLSLDIVSVGLVNDIRSVSLVFDAFRFGFRCVMGGGGASDPLDDDVGNDLPMAYDVDGELLNEPGRGRVNNDKLFCATKQKQQKIMFE